jgi:hypothetical protein
MLRPVIWDVFRIQNTETNSPHSTSWVCAEEGKGNVIHVDGYLRLNEMQVEKGVA